jgi:hypothetical protein
MKKFAPTKTELALLEPFAGLTLPHIHVPTSIAEFAPATVEIKAAGLVGFDTESRPTFVTGDVSDGPPFVKVGNRSGLGRRVFLPLTKGG